MDWGDLVIDADGTFDERTVHIMDSRDQVFQCKTVRLIKVLWKHQGVDKAAWEREDTVRTTYPFSSKDEGSLFSHLIMKIIVAYACDSMYVCV